MDEYMVNKGQLAAIHTLLRKLNLPEDELKQYKAGLVREFTDDRETSTTKLTWKEAQDMIAALMGAVNTPLGKDKVKDAVLTDRKRKRILRYAHLMGREHPDGSVDMDWVNEWCKKHGYLHKPLNDYTKDELSKLIYQMEEVYKSFLKAL